MSFGRVIGCGGGADHQHVPIGKRVERARMLKVVGEGLDLQPRGYCWLLAVFPANDRREMHWRKQILLELRQNRIEADLALDIERLFGIGRKRQRRRRDERNRQQFEGGFHSATPTPWR